MVKCIISFVVPYLLFYLIFSFYEVNFNISGWSDTSRAFCMIFGFAFFIVAINNLCVDDEKNNK